MASAGKSDLLEHLELPDRLEHLELPDRLEHLELPDRLEHLELLKLPDPLALRAPQVLSQQPRSHISSRTSPLPAEAR